MEKRTIAGKAMTLTREQIEEQFRWNEKTFIGDLAAWRDLALAGCDRDAVIEDCARVAERACFPSEQARTLCLFEIRELKTIKPQPPQGGEVS